MKDRIDIGIDGGGTGCRVVVCVDGKEARAIGGPANVLSEPEGAEVAIFGALAEALSSLSLSLDDLKYARIVAGLAGCRLPGTADAFATRLPFLAHVVEDSATALEGAFSGRFGTLVNLGTGSFFIRRDARGITHHGGWGFQLGDEGSAAWLGREALRGYVRIEDGRSQHLATDKLRGELREACGVHPVEFARTAGAKDFGRLAETVMQSRSKWAKQLILRSEDCLVQGLKSVGHPGGTHWCIVGGFGEALMDRSNSQITAGLRPPDGSALDGALAMARALP